jgi:hypothetical protein
MVIREKLSCQPRCCCRWLRGKQRQGRGGRRDAPVLELAADPERLEKVEEVGLCLGEVMLALLAWQDRDRVDAVAVESGPASVGGGVQEVQSQAEGGRGQGRHKRTDIVVQRPGSKWVVACEWENEMRRVGQRKKRERQGAEEGTGARVEGSRDASWAHLAREMCKCTF